MMEWKEIEFQGKCDFCGRKGEKATINNLNGITFLSPDERWICDSCLKSEMRKHTIIG